MPSTESHPTPAHRQSQYRPDIDGLRAIAVSLVVLYHLGWERLSGGYQGVDVFFVISGFLITGILHREIALGGTTLSAFYLRRVRRIFPAMIVVVLSSLLFGYFMLTPGDYRDLAVSSSYSAFGLGNLYFFQHTGYFDQDATLMPLLHLWSLAVEEQYYLLWPGLLLLATRFTARRQTLAVLVSLLTIASFVGSLELMESNAKNAFYNPAARAWELALGALLVFLPPLTARAWIRDAVNLAGLALITFGAVSLNEQSSFPGGNALYACLGAALVVWPKRGRSRVAGLLGIAPLRFIGQISYSLYLWHWPVLVFFRHYALGEPSPAEALLLGLLSVGLAILTWRFVERPFRSSRLPRGTRLKFGFGSVALLALATNVIVSSHGLQSRLPPGLTAISSLERMWEWSGDRELAVDGLSATQTQFGASWASADRRGVLWGDSHAAHLAPYIDHALEDTDISMLLYRTCPAAVDGLDLQVLNRVTQYDAYCATTRTAMLRFLETARVDFVILSAAWSSLAANLHRGQPEGPTSSEQLEMLRDGLADTLALLSARVETVVLIGQIPHWTRDPIPCSIAAMSSLWRRPCAPEATRISARAYQRDTLPSYTVLAEVAARFPNTMLILPGESLCDASGCLAEFDGEPLYRDKTHLRRNLSAAGTARVAELLHLDRIASLGPRVAAQRATSSERVN